MTLDQLGSLGEFVGAIAVVASLAYLALQIRQNTRAVRSAAHQGMVDSLDSLVMKVVDAPDLARIMVAAQADDASLSPEDEMRLLAYASRVFGTWENVFFHRQHGLVDDAMWQAWVAGFRRYATAAPFLRFWHAEKGQYLPEFQEHAEGVMSSSESGARPPEE